MKLFEGTNTTWENLQIAKHKSVECAEWMTLICALRFADFLRLCLSPRTTSRTISFSISNSFYLFLRRWSAREKTNKTYLHASPRVTDPALMNATRECRNGRKLSRNGRYRWPYLICNTRSHTFVSPLHCGCHYYQPFYKARSDAGDLRTLTWQACVFTLAPPVSSIQAGYKFSCRSGQRTSTTLVRL